MIFLLLLVGTTVAVPILPATEAEVEDGLLEEISTGLQFVGPIISSILFKRATEAEVEDGLLEEISTGLQFVGPIISSILFKRAFDPTYVDPPVPDILSLISQLEKRQDIQVEDGLLEEISTGLQFVGPIISSILFKRNVEDGLLEEISTGLQFVGPIISSILFKRNLDTATSSSSFAFPTATDIAEILKLLDVPYNYY